jgi:hypothetical protein
MKGILTHDGGPVDRSSLWHVEVMKLTTGRANDTLADFIFLNGPVSLSTDVSHIDPVRRWQCELSSSHMFELFTSFHMVLIGKFSYESEVNLIRRPTILRK